MPPSPAPLLPSSLSSLRGLGNKMASAEECATACLNHKPGVIQGPYVNLPCNAFAWCPDDICFEPDAHTHHKGDCWLKFTEGPVNPEVRGGGLVGSWKRSKAPRPASSGERWGSIWGGEGKPDT